ncbi:MAG: Crp/Fnr family transcriptional regulator [Phaeospirillum sp.]|nr:Crp/Fnr family transcriptional regulator [Phaeospirillum sp.]
MVSSGNCRNCDAWATRQRQPIRDILGSRCPFPQLSSRFSVGRGQNLFHQGDRVGGSFSLASGMVALERVDVNGALVILKILQPGAFFPCANLLGESRHETSARALSDVTGCFVPVERLTTALREDPAIGIALLKLSSAEIRENEETIFRLYSTDLPDRVLTALMTLADEMGAREDNGDITLTLPISWRDMAAMVGTGPEVISRLLRRLSDAGRISFRGRKVTLHHAAARPAADRYC